MSGLHRISLAGNAHDQRKSAKYGTDWQPNNTAKTCMICDKAWSLTRRRHHCRMCGSLVCGACSSHKIKLESSANKKRVCSTCFARQALGHIANQADAIEEKQRRGSRASFDFASAEGDMDTRSARSSSAASNISALTDDEHRETSGTLAEAADDDTSTEGDRLGLERQLKAVERKQAQSAIRKRAISEAAARDARDALEAESPMSAHGSATSAHSNGREPTPSERLALDAWERQVDGEAAGVDDRRCEGSGSPMDDGDHDNEGSSAEDRAKRKEDRLKRHRERKQKRKSSDKLAAVTAKAIGELERPASQPHRASAPPRAGLPPSVDSPNAISPPTAAGPARPKPAVGFSLPEPSSPAPVLSTTALTEERMRKLVVELSNDIYDMSRVDAIDCVSAMERFPSLLDLWVQTVKQQRTETADQSGAHPDSLIDTETHFFEELADRVEEKLGSFPEVASCTSLSSLAARMRVGTEGSASSAGNSESRTISVETSVGYGRTATYSISSTGFTGRPASVSGASSTDSLPGRPATTSVGSAATAADDAGSPADAAGAPWVEADGQGEVSMKQVQVACAWLMQRVGGSRLEDALLVWEELVRSLDEEIANLTRLRSSSGGSRLRSGSGSGKTLAAVDMAAFEANKLLAVSLHALADCIRLVNALTPQGTRSHVNVKAEEAMEGQASQLVSERKKQAEDALARAIEINEEALGPTHDRVAKNCIALSLLHLERHDFSKGERLCRRAVKILDNAVVSARNIMQAPNSHDPSSTVPLLATALTQHAEVLVEKGKFDDATPLQKRALQIDESALTTALEESMILSMTVVASDTETAASAAFIRSLTRRVVRDLRQLSRICLLKGSLDNALELATQAVSTADSLIPHEDGVDDGGAGAHKADHLRFPCISEHIDLAAALTDQAIALMTKGRLAEGAPIMGRCLAIYQALSEHHGGGAGPTPGSKADEPAQVLLATALNNAAELLRAQGLVDAAEPLLIQALSLKESALGPQSPSVAEALSNLGMVWKAQGRLEEAEPHLKRCIEIKEAVFGQDHWSVAISLNNLARVVGARGNLKEAERLDRRCLAIKTAAHGPDHPSRAVTLNNLAQTCRARGALDEAEKLYRQAVEIWDGVYGDGHPLVATVLNNLGLIVYQRGDKEQAKLLLRRALAIDEAVFGPSHPSVARDQNNLADVLARPESEHDASTDSYEQRRQEAVELLKRSVAIFESFYGENHPHARSVQDNLVRILRDDEYG